MRAPASPMIDIPTGPYSRRPCRIPRCKDNNNHSEPVAGSPATAHGCSGVPSRSASGWRMTTPKTPRTAVATISWRVHVCNVARRRPSVPRWPSVASRAAATWIDCPPTIRIRKPETIAASAP